MEKPVRTSNIMEDNKDTNDFFQYRNLIACVCDYLEIAKKHIKIEINVTTSFNFDFNFCLECGEDMDTSHICNDGYQICYSCGSVKQSADYSAVSYINQTDNSSKEYSDKSNFRKAFQRYMCAQNITFDIEDICDKIDKNLQKKGYPPAAHYREMEHDKYGKKGDSCIRMINESLKSIKKSGFYEDAYLIACNLWGWKPPDIDHLEDIIMEDYDKTQEVYNRIPVNERDRKSCLATQFRLHKHLQLRAHECSKEDFKLPQQSESMRKQEELWKMMCEGCDDPSIYYINS
jgi:hypothetical protein